MGAADNALPLRGSAAECYDFMQPGSLPDRARRDRAVQKTMKKLLIVACLLIVSCQQKERAPLQRHEIQGKVVSVDKGRSQVTLAHEEIPGYMPAMTMPFVVKDEWALSVLAPGQLVQATLVAEGNRSWLEEMAITQPPGEDAGPGAAPDIREPGSGDEIPDFPLTNQDGKRIHLRQYRGSALLLTFIYTRCPLPDYCPRMSGNFAEIYKAARAAPLQNLHLLTISFDPDFDKPEVLRGYGVTWAGGPEAFNRWEFATGTPEEVKKISGYFGLDYWPESGQIIHSLRTALISPEGRLVRLYRGNDWTPRQVLAELRHTISP
jgi:protein SCO1